MNQWLNNISPELFKKWATVVQSFMLLLLVLLFAGVIYLLWQANEAKNAQLFSVTIQATEALISSNEMARDTNNTNKELARSMKSMATAVDRLRVSVRPGDYREQYDPPGLDGWGDGQ